MPFRTKIDFSNNRQIKQFPETITNLSGGTSFGVPFSALTSGPDLTTSGITQAYALITSSFSGNSGTTVFTWGQPDMSLAESQLSAITPSNSAITQTVYAFSANSTTIIDGNTVGLSYTGVYYTLAVSAMTDLGSGDYSGTLVSNNVYLLSAGTLDFTGRTIWVDVSGITRTNDLIVTKNPQVGYVLTCVDSEGKVEWQPSGSTSAVTSYWSASTGTNAIVVNNSDSLASGINSLAEGLQTSAIGDRSHAEGYLTLASGASSHAEGQYTTAIGGFSHAEGDTTIAIGPSSHAEGGNTIAIGSRSHAEGDTTTAFGYTSHAEGSATTAIGDASHAEGYLTIASGDYSHSSGSGSTAIGNVSHAEGRGTAAQGLYSHTEGQYTVAFGEASHAEGFGTTAFSDYSHAEGNTTSAMGSWSHAEGFTTTASGFIAHAEGNSCVASGNFSHAEGTQASATTQSAHAEGQTTLASGVWSHAEGTWTVASGGGSHAEGEFTLSTASGSHAEGQLSTASGTASHAEGSGTTASGIASHAEGYTTTALGIGSHAEGGYYFDGITTYNGGIASGQSSHAEGVLTTASGEMSHAEGFSSVASGILSHAEGQITTAQGGSSHSEGQNTTAIGGASHSEGYTTTSIGDYSHSEGSFTLASGDSSHAEGLSTSATTFGAHAEGAGSIASGYASHAGGNGSIASGNYSFVHGDTSVAQGTTTIVLGANITGTSNDTTYVDYLNVKRVLATAFLNDIRIDANGNLTTNTSDERLKENIIPLSGALDKVKNLQGVTYQWKDRNAGGDDVRLGFIAQQVESVEPLLVFTNKNSEENYKGLHIDGIIPLLVEAVKELSTGTTTQGGVYLETQTILAEDNDIQLNYSGTPQTAIGGGLRVLHALGQDQEAEFITDENGNWITNNNIKAKALTIPYYTPTSSNDSAGSEGNITRDEDYLYVKTSSGWKRSNLESF